MAAHPDAKTLPTDEELMALPKDGNKYELVDGEIVMSPAGPKHGRHIMRFSFALMSYIYANNLGELYDGQTGFRMSSGDVLCPDLSFVTATRSQKEPVDGFFEGAPDLAIEFLSPRESKKHVDRKVELYFSSGARLVWVVDMRRRTISTYRDAKSPRVFAEHETVTGDDLLPGFTIPVATVFAGIPR